LSQEELAERSGLSPHTISNLERNLTRWPYRDTLQRLADGLGLRDEARTAFTTAAGLRRGRAATVPDPANAERRVIPQQLPAPVPGFAGRQHELKLLSELLGRPGGTAVIAAVGGTAGVGKTALAIYWAHQVAAEFPDGQLFVNLRGFDPAGTPVIPADAIRVLLEALDVPPDRLPGTVDAQLGLYRSLLAGKRMLLVLDNARDEGQVRPLLPGALTCRVVVTSRNQLTGLAAIEATGPLTLDVLTETEALQLLGQRLGADRVSSDPGAAERIITSCARLPLALSIIAARAAMQPELPLTQIAADLDARPGLEVFTTGPDPAADIRAALSWSYRQLDADAARAFRLAGLHPGPDFDRYSVAALTGTRPEQADHMLAILARGSLIQPAGPGRHRMHDLLRGYARELTAAQDSEEERRAALTRLFDYYLAAAVTAMDVAFPAEAYRRPRMAAGATAVPALPGPDQARAWLDRERANLVAMVVHSADHGWPRHAADLSDTLHRYFFTGSYKAEAETTYSHVLRAARQCGDLAAEAGALNGLGTISIGKGRFRDAAGHYQAALELYLRCGDLAGQARALNNLGVAEYSLNNLRSAAEYHREAAIVYEEAGDRLGVARALCKLGSAEIELGSLDQASVHLQLALQVFSDAKDEYREADVLGSLGELSRLRGQFTQATAFRIRALDIFRRFGMPGGVANALSGLGDISLSRGDYQQAISYLRQALTLHRDIGDKWGDIYTLRILARTLHKTGQPAAARTELATALRLAAETGNTYELASIHRDLAESHQTAGQHEQARRHWQQALTLYSQLGAPEAAQVRAQLSGPDGETDWTAKPVPPRTGQA
jgi:tetratricopeptide (TPR) repeat protein/transcriptional regulator with XRE-family HTH domain